MNIKDLSFLINFTLIGLSFWQLEDRISRILSSNLYKSHKIMVVVIIVVIRCLRSRKVLKGPSGGTLSWKPTRTNLPNWSEV